MQDLLTFWGQEVVVNEKVIAASIAVKNRQQRWTVNLKVLLCIIPCTPSYHYDVYSVLYSALHHATMMYTLHYTLHSVMSPWCILCIILCTPTCYHYDTLHSVLPQWWILCIILCSPSCCYDEYSALYSAVSPSTMMYTLHYTLPSIMAP